jgi:ABC-type sugar transport system substrate-binding protein
MTNWVSSLGRSGLRFMSARLVCVACFAVALALVAAGCSSSGGSSTTSSGSGSGSGSKSSTAANDPNAFLSAPAGATLLQPKLGAKTTGPITHAPLALPYEGDYSVPAGPIGDPKKTYTICFSQALIHPWATAQKESVMLEAKRHPNVKILYYNTNNDPLEQIRNLSQCQSRKVDAVLVWPHSVGPLTPQINKLCKAGVPVVGMERTVGTHCFTSWIYFDVAGEMDMVAKAVCQQVGNQGKVAEALGTLGSSPEILRHGGFSAGLKKNCPKVQLVTTPATDFGEGTGYSVGLTFLRSPASQGVKAIFADATEAGQGILKAENQVGKSIPIYGVDADRQQVAQVQQGKLAGIVDHTPLHADLALRLAILQLEHKKVPQFVNIEAPALITKDNAGKAVGVAWGPAA